MVTYNVVSRDTAGLEKLRSIIPTSICDLLVIFFDPHSSAQVSGYSWPRSYNILLKRPFEGIRQRSPPIAGVPGLSSIADRTEPDCKAEDDPWRLPVPLTMNDPCQSSW